MRWPFVRRRTLEDRIAELQKQHSSHVIQLVSENAHALTAQERRHEQERLDLTRAHEKAVASLLGRTRPARRAAP